jgi:magnesium chelatase subunit I
VGLDLAGFTDRFAAGDMVETGPLVPAGALLDQLGSVRGLAVVLERLGVDEDNVSHGQVAAAVELVLEGLHLTRRLSKETVDGVTVYGS